MSKLRIVAGSVVLLIGLSIGLAAQPALPDEVTLNLKTGGLTIVGKLVSSDGEDYVVESKTLGTIRVRKERFTCSGEKCPGALTETTAVAASAVKSIRFRGSRTVGLELLPAIIEKHAQKNGGAVKRTEIGEREFDLQVLDEKNALKASLDFDVFGSASAFTDLASGNAEIGMSSRKIRDKEIGELVQAGFPEMNRPDHEHMVGLDGIVVIVAAKNNVGALSLEEMSRVFSGEIRDWSEIGGTPGKINLYVGRDRSVSFELFSDLVLKPYKRSISPDAKRIDVNAELADAVAKDGAGIGMVSIAAIGASKPISIKDTCGLLHEPTEFSVKSGEYPLSRSLYLYTAELKDKYASEIVEYAVSNDADDVVEKVGFVAKSVKTVPFDRFRNNIASSIDAPAEDFDIDLMRQLMKVLGGGHRLSTTMRFVASSSQLDSESVQALSRAVDYLKAHDLSRKQVMVVGYSDSTGKFELNQRLSLERASKVRDGLILEANGELNPDDVEVQAYGELLPVACNDTEMGREKNRRVEIWLVEKDTSRPVVLTKQP